MNKSTLAAAALALCAFTGTASAANDTLQARALNAFGVVIASQGDAALAQIRQDLTQSALEAFKPFLPKPEPAPEQNPHPSAETPAAQR
jgi:hypothetical protein